MMNFLGQFALFAFVLGLTVSAHASTMTTRRERYAVWYVYIVTIVLLVVTEILTLSPVWQITFERLGVAG